MDTKLCCEVATAGHPTKEEDRDDFAGSTRLSNWFRCRRCDAKMCGSCYQKMFADPVSDTYNSRDGNQLWWSLTLCGTCKHADDTVHPERMREVCTCPSCVSSAKTSIDKARASTS